MLYLISSLSDSCQSVGTRFAYDTAVYKSGELVPISPMITINLYLKSQNIDDARIAIIQQLQTLTGVAKGLTRTNDTIFVLDDDDNPAEDAKMRLAREDPLMARLRELMLDVAHRVFEVWSTDASVSDVSLSTHKQRPKLTTHPDHERFHQSYHLPTFGRDHHFSSGRPVVGARMCSGPTPANCCLAVTSERSPSAIGSTASLSDYLDVVT
jgi:hypothetical protein